MLVENYWDCWSKLNIQDYKSDVDFDTEFNKKIKRTATWGKYTKSAYGATRYGGWTTSDLFRFIELFEQVKADRLKNGEIVEEEYVQHCIINKTSPQNGKGKEL